MEVDCIHDVEVRPVTFKNGTTHLERRCTLCGKHFGYQKKSAQDRSLERKERRHSLGLLEERFFKNLHQQKHERSPKMDKNKIINWGKYDGLGMTYDAVAIEDRDYFEWIIKQPVDVENRILHKWTRRVHPLIKAALQRNTKYVYMPEVLDSERQEAVDHLTEMRRRGLDFFLDKEKMEE